MSTIPQLVKDARVGMDKALETSRKEFSSIRSGKASTSLLDTVRVDAYGQSMPMSQVGSVSAPESRLLTVTPWDKGLTQAIEKAIRDSNLGLSPVIAFWTAYVITRPLGASFADWIAKEHSIGGGLNVGDGDVTALSLVTIVALVAYLAVTGTGVQRAADPA